MKYLKKKKLYMKLWKVNEEKKKNENLNLKGKIWDYRRN